MATQTSHDNHRPRLRPWGRLHKGSAVADNAGGPQGRSYCELLRLCLDAGVEGNRAEIALAPTHAELANRIGSHREAVTRELQYLQGEGIAAREGRRFVVEDMARLAEIVRAAAGDVDLLQRALDAQA